MVQTVLDALGLRKFSVEEYHRMGDAGVFGPEERVELIRGVVRQMSPKGRRHVIAVSKATELFVLAVSGRARVYVQDPMTSDVLDSEPEPDLCVMSNPDPRSYRTPEATPLLVIEVADSSLQFDRSTKLSLYADAQIPEYWIVNLVEDVVEIYREPQQGRYGSRQVLKGEESVATLAWPDVKVKAKDLLP